MKKLIKLTDIFSEDLYTRSRASELRSYISKDADTVTLDFEGVNFISRSFADELCNIIDDIKDNAIALLNMNDEVSMMMTKVREGRNRERRHGISTAKMHKFNDIESLSDFLIAM